MDDFRILPMVSAHWRRVKEIYESGIATGQATFQTTAPDWEDWERAHFPSCRLIAVGNGEVLGWAALSPVSGRPVYQGVAEVSVYLDAPARGRGWGKQLLGTLVEESEKHGFWTLQASIFPENKASLRVHEACGFRMVGTREKIGQMKGTWRDTFLLERRSRVTGV